MRKKTKCTVLAVMLAASLSLAEDLKLEVEVNGVGSVLVYMTNVSESPVTVLTKGLSRTDTAGPAVVRQLSPNKYMRGKTLIRQSLAEYHPVMLDPGQTTWIQYHGVRDSGYDKGAASFQLVYSVDEEWGRFHKVWYGTVEADRIPLTDGRFSEAAPATVGTQEGSREQ